MEIQGVAALAISLNSSSLTQTLMTRFRATSLGSGGRPVMGSFVALTFSIYMAIIMAIETQVNGEGS